MEQNESVLFFLRFLKEKHELFKSRLNNLFAVLVENNHEAKKKSAEQFYKAAQDLRDNLSDQDSPHWLNESVSAIDYYLKNITNSGINNALLRRLLLIHNDAISHQWQFEDTQMILAFDFDSIYEQCKRESRVDELFDNIISCLRKLIESEEIDSIKIKNTLERLIATLSKHNSASYFSIHSMWDFLGHLMKNVLWEELESIPGLSGVVKGLRKTIEETGIEMEDLNSKMKNSMNQKYNSDFSFLNSVPRNLLEENQNK
ncbi:MAG: hypothetical protein HYZ10_01470 [Ignavibacteriales bacterium]|nr:hypothetical protein [Ignavibacteriales bacterium]